MHQPEMEVDNLTCNQRIQPVGVECESPVMGWQIVSGRDALVQSDYRIIVSDDPEGLAIAWFLYTSGKGLSIQMAVRHGPVPPSFCCRKKRQAFLIKSRRGIGAGGRTSDWKHK